MMDDSIMTSFPQSGSESPQTPQSFLNLYDRVRSAASSVLGSFLPEDQQSIASPQLDPAPPVPPKPALTVQPPNQGPSVHFGHARRGSRDSTLQAVNLIRGSSRRNSMATVEVSKLTAQEHAAVQANAIAVPVQAPYSDGIPTQNFPVYIPHSVDMSDVDSMFSVGTPSVSRAYLANHYHRSRQHSFNSLSRDFWMKDENATTCFRCSRQFTTFRRRHHCRVCGQIFCSSCTQLLPGDRFHQKGRVRCCLNCINSMNSQQSSSEDEDANISSVLDLNDGHSVHTPVAVAVPNAPEDDDDGDRYSMHPFSPATPGPFSATANRGDNGSSPIVAGMEFPTFTSARRGSITSSSPDTAIVDDDDSDVDNDALARQQFSNLRKQSISRVRSGTSRSVRDTLSLQAAFEPRDSHTGNGRPSMTSSARFPTNKMTSTVDLNRASLEYSGYFLDQILRDSELDIDTWHPTILPQLLSIASGSHIELLSRDRMNPGQWVKLKTLPGGQPKDMECVNGIVFTHNVALRSMATRVQNPRILLISFPLEYSRGDDAYMSLNPILAQETEYLRKLVTRIQNLRPTVLLSSSRISGTALKMLDAAGIVVAANVRELALNRLSRYIRSDVLTSVDRLSTSPYLGHINLFEVRTYKYGAVAKSFMFFTGLSEGNGCTILIRGRDDQIGKVKIVLEIMVDVVFSLKMETSLLRDQFVKVPDLEGEPTVLSSSPFVDYGEPALLTMSRALEDNVVKMTDEVDELSNIQELLEREAKRVVEKPTKETESETVPVEEVSEEVPKPEDQENVQVLIESSKKKIIEIAKRFNISETRQPGGVLSMIKMLLAIQQNNADRAYSLWMDVKHHWDLLEAQNPHMFNPSSHQNLILTFALFNMEASLCVGPENLLIEFYLDTDLSLGQFVESAIQSYNDPCPDGCQNKLGEHKRSYFHGNGILAINVEDHPSEIQGMQNSIMMWSTCKICDKSTPIIPMSPSTWKYSFGKYLELSFWGEPLPLRADTCVHNIYRDHVRYFGWMDKALIIEYSDIELYDVFVPRLTVDWTSQDLVKIKNETYRNHSQRIKLFWASLLENLGKVKVEGLNDEKLVESQDRLEELKQMVEADRKACLIHLDEIFLSTSPTDLLSLNEVIQFVQDLVVKWHEALDTFDGLFFPAERDIRRVTAQQLRGLFLDEMRPERSMSKSDTDDHQAGSFTSSERPFNSNEEKTKPDEAEQPTTATDGDAQEGDEPAKAEPQDIPIASESNVPENPSTPTTRTTDTGAGADSPSVRVKSKFGTEINLPVAPLQGSIPTGAVKGTRVSVLARHFEELAREFERERQRERQRLYDRQQSLTMKSTRPVADVFQNVNDAVRVDWDQLYGDNSHDSDSSIGGRSKSNTPGPAESNDETDLGPAAEVDDRHDVTDDATTNQDIDEAGDEDEGADYDEEPEPRLPRRASVERKSLIKSLVNFWAERSSTRWSGIEYMLTPEEHIFSDSLVIIRDNEPSSLIAFCISLPDYEARINEIYNPVNAEEDVSVEQVMLKQTGVHMRYQFIQGSTKLSCKIFFSEQFDALRKQCRCDEYYVQSLSRCSPWENSGGKSGSSFLKTIDDRMIIKELSQSEFDALATFLPSYFEYMAQALFHDLPTALTKIFGVYQLQIYNPTVSTNVKLYVLVMENLFYGRNFTRFFDLKGSMRNRKVAETGRANEVLLDENMVEYIYEKPMYVRDHSKKTLRASLYNDTLFLTKMNVMDYSLVLGIDEDGKTIVAGIIDFIRTFTWDKKVESWVKGRATGGVKEPTVISPKQYKVRFRESMERYFLLVPDCWMQPAQPV